MIIYILFFCLISSFTLHIIIIVLYIKIKDNKYFYWFIATVVLNMTIAGLLIVVTLSKPELIRELNLKMFFWLLSGFVTFLLLGIKILIFRNIYRRSKNPKWYHVNYFGKKVYEKGIVKQIEFLGVFFILPFFLIIGAFFVSRFILFIMTGKM
ncbi:MAG: hypothetical protein E4G96_03850 [Chrysiogenales bacterium]|nr:MAG: hypothetical protein E4G96_03850 [Chrysiogenales bacterium]